MGNISKFVSVKLLVKFEGECKFVNVKELKFVLNNVKELKIE
jgi:hypothetical protein